MTDILNEKSLTMYELFHDASKSPDPVEFIKMHMKKDSRIIQVLGYAMNPSFKMGIPEGTPPYIPSDVPLGLAEIELLHLAQKLYILYDTKAPKAKREIMLIQWMEKMAQVEAEMLILIKDKMLHTMFPEVTEDVLLKAIGWDRAMYDKLKAKC